MGATIGLSTCDHSFLLFAPYRICYVTGPAWEQRCIMVFERSSIPPRALGGSATSARNSFDGVLFNWTFLLLVSEDSCLQVAVVFFGIVSDPVPVRSVSPAVNANATSSG
jgi:hypothetical protein